MGWDGENIGAVAKTFYPRAWREPTLPEAEMAAGKAAEGLAQSETLRDEREPSLRGREASGRKNRPLVRLGNIHWRSLCRASVVERAASAARATDYFFFSTFAV